MPLIEEGRAKVNLTLRVIGRRVDGYHDLESLVAFADCADRLTLAPGAELKLITTGPSAGDCGDASDNLVLRAARLLAERVPGLKLGEFTLDKVLPVAAGIGGGSADAAAALRLLARLNGLAPDDPRLLEVALLTGADVPVCLVSRASDMTGVGESLLPLSLPIMPCVLVSPDSVARFFPAQAGLFDLVVFDEASQIRVADAVWTPPGSTNDTQSEKRTENR